MNIAYYKIYEDILVEESYIIDRPYLRLARITYFTYSSR